MFFKYLLIAIVLLLFYVQTNCVEGNGNGNGGSDDNQSCHRKCTHRSQFTDRELETVRKYIQNRYINRATIAPKKPACKRLQVMRDFKCMTDRERRQWAEAFLGLYRSNYIDDSVSYWHGNYWPFWHLMAASIPAHNQFLNDGNQLIQKIDRNVVLPYWDTTVDFGAPEKAVIWDYIGRAGNSRNDYCVTDGMFNRLTLKHPTPHCLRRQWNSDGTIPTWESPELLTYILQHSVGQTLNFAPMFYSQHFKKHLNIGGYNGDIAIPFATNDPAFWLFHYYELFEFGFKWQLQDDSTLTPIDFGLFGRHIPPNACNGSLVYSDIGTDTLLGFNNVTIVEPLQFGFGDFCYIPDVTIEAILNVANNRRPRYPAAVDRLRRALPPEKFAEFFPLFANNTANEFNYILPDVGDRRNGRCKPLPLPPRFNSTATGIRQFDRFNTCDQNLQASILFGEQQIEAFINTLNSYGYCSPYLD